MRDLLDRIAGRRSRVDGAKRRPRSVSEASPDSPGAENALGPGEERDLEREARQDESGARPAHAAPPEDDDPAEAQTAYERVPGWRKDEVVAVLVAIDGELKGEVFKLYDGENKLGRSAVSDVVLTSKWVSREHAVLVHQQGVFAIVPLSETNPTYLNDREVDGAELSDSDVIRLGHTTLRFKSVEGV